MFRTRPVAAMCAALTGLTLGCTLALPVTESFAVEEDLAYVSDERVALSAAVPASHVKPRVAAPKPGAAGHCDELAGYLAVARPWIEGGRNIFQAKRDDTLAVADAASDLAASAPAHLKESWRSLSSYLRARADGKASQYDFVRLSEKLSLRDRDIEKDALVNCGITWPK